jgi:hypothetical protein
LKITYTYQENKKENEYKDTLKWRTFLHAKSGEGEGRHERKEGRRKEREERWLE